MEERHRENLGDRAMMVSIPLMAQSARMNRLRLALTASISLIVVTNAILLIGMLDSSASIMVAAIVFCSTFLPVFVLLLDTMSRSNQSLTVFRSLGAKKRTAAVSILVTLVGAGLIGAIGGAGVGLLLARAYAEVIPVLPLAPRALPIAQGTAYVLGSFVAGFATAVVAGVRFSWYRLS